MLIIYGYRWISKRFYFYISRKKISLHLLTPIVVVSDYINNKY